MKLYTVWDSNDRYIGEYHGARKAAVALNVPVQYIRDIASGRNGKYVIITTELPKVDSRAYQKHYRMVTNRDDYFRRYYMKRKEQKCTNQKEEMM